VSIGQQPCSWSCSGKTLRQTNSSLAIAFGVDTYLGETRHLQHGEVSQLKQVFFEKTLKILAMWLKVGLVSLHFWPIFIVFTGSYAG